MLYHAAASKKTEDATTLLITENTRDKQTIKEKDLGKN